jgi:hypothetical protein
VRHHRHPRKEGCARDAGRRNGWYGRNGLLNHPKA